MSVDCMNAIWRACAAPPYSTLDAVDRLLIVALADRTNRVTGRCDPSLARLAEFIGVDEKTVRRRLPRLEEIGLVVRRERPGRPSQYEVRLTPGTLDARGTSGAIAARGTRDNADPGSGHFCPPARAFRAEARTIPASGSDIRGCPTNDVNDVNAVNRSNGAPAARGLAANTTTTTSIADAIGSDDGPASNPVDAWLVAHPALAAWTDEHPERASELLEQAERLAAARGAPRSQTMALLTFGELVTAEIRRNGSPPEGGEA
jgi:hypothetical protein